ncbi:transglycosylase SLT domain-containing protein [Candidatus Woesearchaeota archaeon]|nr:transglycosylase SLT domain-containing protein [Candidatus Woesearchaeota archaeon]
MSDNDHPQEPSPDSPSSAPEAPQQASRGRRFWNWGTGKASSGAKWTATNAWAGTKAVGSSAVVAGRYTYNNASLAGMLIFVGLLNHLVDWSQGFAVNNITFWFDVFILIVCLATVFGSIDDSFGIEKIRHAFRAGMPFIVIFCFEILYPLIQQWTLVPLFQYGGVDATRWLGVFFLKALWPAWLMYGVSKSKSRLSTVLKIAWGMLWILMMLNYGTFNFIYDDARLSPEQQKLAQELAFNLGDNWNSFTNQTGAMWYCSGSSFSSMFNPQAMIQGKPFDFNTCLKERTGLLKSDGEPLEDLDGKQVTALPPAVQVQEFFCGDGQNEFFFDQDLALTCSVAVQNRKLQKLDFNVQMFLQKDKQLIPLLKEPYKLSVQGTPQASLPRTLRQQPSLSMADATLQQGKNTVLATFDIAPLTSTGMKTFLVMDQTKLDAQPSARLSTGPFASQIQATDAADGTVDGVYSSISPAQDVVALAVNTKTFVVKSSEAQSLPKEELIVGLASSSEIVPRVKIENKGLSIPGSKLKGQITQVNGLFLTVPAGFSPKNCDTILERKEDYTTNTYVYKKEFLAKLHLDALADGKYVLVKPYCTFAYEGSDAFPTPQQQRLQVAMDFSYRITQELPVEIVVLSQDELYASGKPMSEDILAVEEEHYGSESVPRETPAAVPSGAVYYLEDVKQAVKRSKYGVTVEQVIGLIATESNWNPDTVSCNGQDVGLSQANYWTAKGREYVGIFKTVNACSCTACQAGSCAEPSCSGGKDGRFEPSKSIQFVVAYLDYLQGHYKQYTDKVKFAFAAYNGGFGVIDQAIKATDELDPSWDVVKAQLTTSMLNARTYAKLSEASKQKKINIIKNYVARVSSYSSGFTADKAPPKLSIKTLNGDTGQVLIAWDAPSVSFTYQIQVERSPQQTGPYSIVGKQIPASSTTYTDANPLQGVSVYYRLVTLRVVEGVTYRSEGGSKQVDVGQNQPPAAPGMLTAVYDAAANKVTLSWQLSSDDPFHGGGSNDVSGYILAKADADGNQQEIGTPVAGAKQMVDRTVLAGQTYTYTIRAKDKGGLLSATASTLLTIPEVTTV